MIIEEYDESLFISRFEDYKRVNKEDGEGGNFTYRGLRALFQYLDDLSDDENPYTLDVIALCCEYVEFKNLDEYLNDYYQNEEIESLKKDYPDEQDFKDKIEEEINNKTTLIKFDDDLNDGFIIAHY